MKTNRLTTEEKQHIAILAAQGSSCLAIGNAIGRDDKTVARALKKEDVQALVTEAQQRIGLKWQEISESILDRITEGDIEKAGLRDKVVAGGIALDKSRLALGLSTENVSRAVKIVLATNSDELSKLVEGEE
ncbi:helix-turn-helix domain-containing protein [Geobacter sp. DSM 9736]|uniref:helix-turn-helix domain-containing protein n=1 Tax=Geobacter sp. DSM 9736 TaxID=1277350 RepID=UPI000B4FF119|nr:helix-turn-helix domain-containing protein [Geobacter sp. DSM 9736]SNB45943.1 Helix-turn-helix domain-containing protein [Geobacter sp. DSM 9736]